MVTLPPPTVMPRSSGSARQIDERRRRCEPLLHGREQRHAAGERAAFAIASEQRDRFGEVDGLWYAKSFIVPSYSAARS